MSFFRFVNKWAIYRLGIISLAHVPVHVTDFPVVNEHVDVLSSARIWQNKLCATLSANVNINYRLPIKVYYRICTLRHIRIKIIHGSQNVFWVLTWVADISILSWARGDYFWNIPRHDADVLTKMVYIISYSSHLNKKYSERIFITYRFQYRIKQTFFFTPIKGINDPLSFKDVYMYRM